MRSWITTRDACKALRLGQQRVSQLCNDGTLAATKDDDGNWQIDRESIESLVAERAQKKARTAQEREEARALAEENRDRLRRQRAQEKQRELARVARLDELQERGVAALERIAKYLDHKEPRDVHNYLRRG